jgi:hypothetical protein
VPRAFLVLPLRIQITAPQDKRSKNKPHAFKNKTSALDMKRKPFAAFAGPDNFAHFCPSPPNRNVKRKINAFLYANLYKERSRLE